MNHFFTFFPLYLVVTTNYFIALITTFSDNFLYVTKYQNEKFSRNNFYYLLFPSCRKDKNFFTFHESNKAKLGLFVQAMTTVSSTLLMAYFFLVTIIDQTIAVSNIEFEDIGVSTINASQSLSQASLHQVKEATS